MINMLRNCLLLATLVLGAMFSEHAAAQNWTQVGTLSCRDDPNIGFIIIGHQPTQCVYSQAPGAVPQVPPQSYDGALSTIGVALGVSTGSVLGWAGLSSRRQPACRPEHLPANMSAFRPMSVSAWALERTCSLAARTERLRCSRYRFRVTAINVIAGVSSLKLRWH